MITIYLDLSEDNTVQGWGTSQERQGNTFPVKLPLNHPFLAEPGFGYWYVTELGELEKDEKLLLDSARLEKLNELKDSCREDIIHGFDFAIEGTTYHFNYSELDQQNMIQNKYTLELGERIIPWRGYDEEGNSYDLEIGNAQFNTMFQTAVRVKNKKLRLLHEYYPKLLNTLTDVEEIREVTWDSSIEVD